jgi:hypothetical protein
MRSFLKKLQRILRQQILCTILCALLCIILCTIFFPSNIVSFRDNMEKYGTFGQATDENIIWRMGLALWISKAADRS